MPITYDVSVVIPCYNEEAILEDSVREIACVMDQTRYTWEAIFIDDRSSDQTPSLLSKLIVNAVLDHHPTSRVAYIPNRTALAPYLRQALRPGDLCLALGAGDLPLLTDELLGPGI